MTIFGFEPGMCRAETLRRAARVLEQTGIVEACGDARFLLLHILGLTSADLALRGAVPLVQAETDALTKAFERRLAGEPVARILGEWEFRGLTFALSPETLVPRPDTETLVDTALRLVSNPTPTILDLGTGSGCILVALLDARRAARGIGVDRSEGALVIARRNAISNGVEDRACFVRGDWCEAVRGPFDLILSNPPYIASNVIPTLAEGVRRYDPVAALDGGPDGLDAYRAILHGLIERPDLLAPHATIALEIGYDQAEAVSALANDAGLFVTGVEHDLAGHPRVVTLRPPFHVTSAGNKVVR